MVKSFVFADLRERLTSQPLTRA